MDSTDDLMTTGEAAALMACSRQHVVDMCRRGLLPYVRIGSHRRLRREDIEALMRPNLTRDQERALWLHQVVAAKLVTDPDRTLAKARSNLAKQREAHPRGMVVESLDQWHSLIEGRLHDLLDMVTSRSAYAIELRQNSPFAGALSEHERTAALDTFRKHWRRI